MKTILCALLALVSSLWFIDLASPTFPPNTELLWIVRQEAMYLTGLLSITLMSLSMLLATRPGWLEKPFGGLDRIYRMHKWSGILAISFAAAHWLAELSGDIIKSMIGKVGRLPKMRYDGLLEVLRELGKDFGEPALYIMLAMLVITLWRRFPYPFWRHLHRIMPVLYLMLALHSVMLSPPAYWSQPLGALMAVFIGVGVISSFISLSGMIGRKRQAKGTVSAVKTTGDLTEITCRIEGQWPAHQAGQFAFLTFSWLEGAHPFTIASAASEDRTMTFCIKGLGDFTKDLGQRLQPGQSVTIEGPYGRFLLDRHSPKRRQIWVAGGIGITPFLSWLESLQSRPEEVRAADLHYCIRNRESDPFIARLQTLCASLPGVQLHIHSAQHGEKLNAAALSLADDRKEKAEIWFCGPTGLAEALKQSLKASWNGSLRFHQEAFEMR
ncbi:MAG: ferric reductase-like transmembrane domain-containing protein [Betaproteobacteria bacterium]